MPSQYPGIVFRKRSFHDLIAYYVNLWHNNTTGMFSDIQYTGVELQRLTSPNLNYCIIAGAILIYGSVFVSLPVSS